MFRNVFVGVDGSSTGRDAIALARALAEPDARLTLAHVNPGSPTPHRAANLDFDAVMRADAQRLLEAEREATGVGADLISISAPSIGRGLHALAEEHAADLLVVGSTSRGLAGRVLVGDDTRASLNGAPCAVAVAPLGYVAQTGGFSRIGVGYDFSGESQAALEVARALASRDRSKLSVLHVVPLPTAGYLAPMPGTWGEILEEDRQAAQKRVSTLEGVEALAVYGSTSEELALFGSSLDLLVVGSRSYGPMRRLVFGSTSSRLAHRARCPLLVLPRSAIVNGSSEEEDSTHSKLPAGVAS
jgi:nucleotide-binding universal stress UspA family protein